MRITITSVAAITLLGTPSEAQPVAPGESIRQCITEGLLKGTPATAIPACGKEMPYRITMFHLSLAKGGMFRTLCAEWEHSPNRKKRTANICVASDNPDPDLANRAAAFALSFGVSTRVNFEDGTKGTK